MIEQTEFIPLRVVKYKERSLVLTGITPQGRKDFFLNSYIKNKKNKYPFLAYPLPILEITYFRRSHFNLPIVSDMQLVKYSPHVLFSPPTQILLTFLAEIYYAFLRHVDSAIYAFIRSKLFEIFNFQHLNPTWVFVHLVNLLEQLGFGLQKWMNWDKDLELSNTFADTPIGKIHVRFLRLLYHLTQSDHHLNIPPADQMPLLETIIKIFHSHFSSTREIQSMRQMELFFSFFENKTPS
ncbi:MAG: recombination protein O N-terminal domain-containing protein [Bacteroidales bacterium]|nr:recombination protein O N-terminal domain-containing protein [Bacteroidales bacterium]